MFRRISETFTATHVTIMFVATLLVPGVLYGAVSYQNVAITDPGSGRQSFIDPGRRLYVIDPVVAYANTPNALVDIPFQTSSGASNGTACSASIYTIPAGRALIIREISGYIENTSTDDASFYLQSEASCASSSEVTSFLTQAPGSSPLSISLGTGAAIPGGKKLYVFNGSSLTRGYIHGYLVPSNAVPAASSAEAAALNVPVMTAAKPSPTKTPR